MADAAYYRAQFEELSRQFEQVIPTERPRPSVISAVRHLDTYVDSAWAILPSVATAADIRAFQRLAKRAAVDLLDYRGPETANAWLNEIDRLGLCVERTNPDSDRRPEHLKVAIASCVRSSIQLCEEIAARPSAPDLRTRARLEALVSVTKAAKLLGVHPDTVVRMQHAGKIGTVRVNRLRQVPREDLLRLLDSGEYPNRRPR